MSEGETVTVLIVDDNAQYREAFARALILESFDVREAVDLESALKSVQSEPPDVVVTDLQMRTDREGLDLIEIIKAFDPLLPVIMISGVGSFEDGAMATKLGAVHVIHKSRIEDEMTGLFEAIQTAHAAGCKSREQLALVTHAREVALEPERETRITAVRELLAGADVDPYVKSEAYDLIASLGNPEVQREYERNVQAAASSDRYEELSREAQARLEAEVPDYAALDAEAKRALTTAEYLCGTHGEDGAPDFSRSIAFSYSLAVECEVRARLKGRITRLSTDVMNRHLFEACMDPKARRVDVCFQQSLMQAVRSRHIHFTTANVKYVMLGLLSRKGNFKADGLKDVGIILLCFAREYSFSRWGQQIDVRNPLRLKGLKTQDEIINLAGLLIALQYARNPYVHPDTGKRESLAALRQTALDCLNELAKLV